MGERLRLKRGVAIDGYPPRARVLLQAMRDYGLIVADNGSPWYVTGAPDARWSEQQLATLKRISGDDFEVVDGSGLQ